MMKNRISVSLHLSYACNMNCSYCYANEQEYPGNMDILGFRQLLPILKDMDMDIVDVMFLGGEPLLHKYLIYQIVKECSNITGIKFGFGLITNGLLLDEEFLNFAVNNNLTISISLDGCHDAHDLNHRIGNQGSWEEVYSNLCMTLEYFPLTPVLVTLNPNTVPYLSESIFFLFDKGVKRISLSVNYMTDWKDDDFYCLREELEKVVKYYVANYDKQIWLNVLEEKIKAHICGFSSKGRCELGISHLSLTPDGEIFPCIAFVSMDKTYSIGNVQNGINERKLEVFKQSAVVDEKECENCNLKDRCFHWCACTNYLATGYPTRISPNLCQFEQTFTKAADKVALALYNAGNETFIARYYQ